MYGQEKIRLFNVWSFRGKSLSLSHSPRSSLLLALSFPVPLVGGLFVDASVYRPSGSRHSYAVWTTRPCASNQEIIGNQTRQTKRKGRPRLLKKKIIVILFIYFLNRDNNFCKQRHFLYFQNLKQQHEQPTHYPIYTIGKRYGSINKNKGSSPVL